MNLNKENELQHLNEKNGKIWEINNIKFILRESEEYQVLTDLIRNISQKKEIKRILIIGNNLIQIYSGITMIFPDAQFYITNKSKNILEFFKEHYKNQKNYSTYILDVLKGASVYDFIYNKSKFDLVIANKLYSKVKEKKRYLSIRFLYKFYLRQYGILCLINYIQYSKGDKFNLLDPIKPILEKKIPVKKEKYSIQFILYTKNNKHLLF